MSDISIHDVGSKQIATQDHCCRKAESCLTGPTQSGVTNNGVTNNGVTDDISDSALREHSKKVSDTRTKIAEALRSIGHSTDDTVSKVDGVYVGLFVIPSPNHLYIAYGPTGSRQAYRGPDSAMDPSAIANDIATYVKSVSCKSAN